ncbi:MAG: hypothetical protein Q4P20_04340 [Eubacteriales bacterium]|nr:hypothetical protein [Eubacteriales bacterium]
MFESDRPLQLPLPGAVFLWLCQQIVPPSHLLFVDFYGVRSRERKLKNIFTTEKSSIFLSFHYFSAILQTKMSNFSGLSGIFVQLKALFIKNMH